MNGRLPGPPRWPVACMLLLAMLCLRTAPAPVSPAPLFGPVAVSAATPTASPGGGDVRSSGEGAGAAGNPGFALVSGLAVVVAGVLIALATTLYVRLTGRVGGGP